MHRSKDKNVLIPQSLFGMLVKYFLLHDHTEEEKITVMLEQKLNQLMKHQYYSNYKQETDPMKQEQARKQYLEQAGVSDDFRW